MGKLLPKKFVIQFIDSFKFLQASLANLVSKLQPSDFKNLNRVIKNNSSLLTRKGVYPYDYVASINKLKQTKLPSKEDFYSKLYDQEISDEDYQHALKVWVTFNCQTLQDYHDLYLKTDVLLPADVFENFRKTISSTSCESIVMGSPPPPPPPSNLSLSRQTRDVEKR